MTTELAVLALRRFGLGPRPGDAERIETDPRAALFAELDAPGIATLDGPALPDTGSAFIAIRRDQMERQAARAQTAALPGVANGKAAAMNGNAPAMSGNAAATAMATEMKPLPAPKPNPPSVAQTLYRAEIAARFERQRAAPIGYVERLVAFWSNHFAVQADKDEMVRGLAGAFEREAIRPFVLGRFEDMLMAATRHPAMLLSLDNAGSIGPDSAVGKKRDRGLNENHARELLELHTVGVDGGYTQSDVTAFARVLTGWTFQRDLTKPQAGIFDFRPEIHQPGDQAVLGKVYKADLQYAVGNEGQGEAVLHDLATRPATALHLARKLARHFISDQPPQPLVDRLAQIFSASGGNLKAVAKAMLQAPEALAEGRKFATPQQFVLASARALDVDIEPQRIVQYLNLLGQPIWNPPSPEGFHDDSATWLAPDAITSRLDIADRIAQQAALARRPTDLAADLLGPAASPETMQAIQRAESGRQAVALLVMSPEFQWR